ncbi:MAG: hypothetical protein A2Y66_09190 [Nitrospirae bacterium RBG_13_41_22]|nr:MAG: hypothetical protein A2Y66_09190 [Nitrospirae bacterium RBG_13_41_22]
MSLAEKILEHLQELPVPFQAEVLDFVEYLESKIKKGGSALAIILKKTGYGCRSSRKGNFP